MTDTKAKIFLSYSHKDEALKEQLMTHLAILRRKDQIEDWHDRRIIAGQDWEYEIDNELFSADLIVLLISPDFIASDYCYSKELSKAIELHEANHSIVIPVILRPGKWNGAPFAKIQALPRDAKAATTWENIDEAWMNVTEGIEKAIVNISKLKTRRHKNSGLKKVSELLISEADRILKIYDDESNCSGISTGIQDLDNAIDGLHPSDLVVIASRPDNGGNSVALNIVKHVAVNVGLPVAYYSFQMTSNRLTQKLICVLGGVSQHNLLHGALEDKDWANLTNALGILNDAPLYIDDSDNLSLKGLVDSIKELNYKCGRLGLVVIDSLQSLHFQSDSKIQIGNYSKSLKYLAKELNTTIVVTSNVSMDVELRIDKRPLIRDLDDWKVIEEDADMILMSYVDEVYNSDSVDRDTIELLILKNSYGHIGKVRALYSKENFILSNLTDLLD